MILFLNCRLEQIRPPPLSALNDIEAMIVQTDSTCIWAVYEWYCTRIFFFANEQNMWTGCLPNYISSRTELIVGGVCTG
jgi:hypothetical protein